MDRDHGASPGVLHLADGVFVARDVISFYTFFEASLVPGFFMLAIYGGPDRRHASYKFFIYTFVGSLFMLLALAYVAWQYAEQTGTKSFAIADLAPFAATLSGREQSWLLLARGSRSRFRSSRCTPGSPSPTTRRPPPVRSTSRRSS